MKISQSVIKVSVCVVTFNHESYIRQCLESLVNQNVNFDFEVIVADDCSTDNTRIIIQELAEKYPDVLKPFYHKENIGPYKNFIFVHQQARGEYIAHMDGDDYSLPGKLISQAKYLDINLNCAMVFHRCLLLYPDGKLVPPGRSVKFNEPCNFAEFLYFYPSNSWHSSKMYRRSANLERMSTPQKFIDKHIHFEHGLSGLVGFVNKNLGVYRVGVGISSNIKSIQEMALNSYSYAIELGYDENLIKKIIAKEQFEQGLRLLERDDLLGFKEYVEIGFNSGYRNANSFLAYSFKSSPRIYIYLRDFIRKIKTRMK